jgi:adenylylsulfate kinase-like enzyme
MIPTLLLTGTLGSGKTSTAVAVAESLPAQGLTSVVVDLDWLGWLCRPVDATGDEIHELIVRNLRSMWPNFVDVGVQRVVLARTVQHAAQIESLRSALPEADIRVVRLTASPATIEGRLRRRDTGPDLDEHLAESVAFTRQLDEIGNVDLTVETDGRDVQHVAAEILERLPTFAVPQT